MPEPMAPDEQPWDLGMTEIITHSSVHRLNYRAPSKRQRRLCQRTGHIAGWWMPYIQWYGMSTERGESAICARCNASLKRSVTNTPIGPAPRSVGLVELRELWESDPDAWKQGDER